jgi:hypothetical protein
VTGCETLRSRLRHLVWCIPQAAAWQRIADAIKAAFIFARSDLVADDANLL